MARGCDAWTAATAGVFLHWARGGTGPRRASGRNPCWPATSWMPWARPSSRVTGRAWVKRSRLRRRDGGLAERLAASLRGGEVVLLRASWGPGRPPSSAGLARGLGVDPEEVASPTFVLLTVVPGRLRLHHADLYRLAGTATTASWAGGAAGAAGVLAIEWAERLSLRPWRARSRSAPSTRGGRRGSCASVRTVVKRVLVALARARRLRTASPAAGASPPGPPPPRARA
jgi:tRNA A37 threonylcarbamoyladenosine biosynthesis protein TsaE